MTEYNDHYYQSSDGLRLYARCYGDSRNKKVILCMHGLSRNSADFHEVALHLSDRYRIIVPDQRGRGNSDWDHNTANYNPQTYVDDMWTLLATVAVEKAALIGTSMGGLMAMIMGATAPQRVMAIVLNDVGPELETAGLERIKAYIGKASRFISWQDLAVKTRELQGNFFPHYSDGDWLAMAHRTGVAEEDGSIVFNYDPSIAVPIQEDESAAVPTDLWPLFDLLKNIEMMTVRGEISDLLSGQTLANMVLRHQGMVTHIVPDEGHAPMMNNKATLAALDMWASRSFDRSTL